MSTDRKLAKVARLDADIASLRDRLDVKLTERRTLLAALINEGETLRGDIADQVRVITHATTLAATGRLLTEDQVREIRKLHKSGVSQGEIARRYSLSQPTIFKIVRRQTYADVA